MAYYRLYFMDGFTGHIEHFREFDAESDEAAVAYAEDALGSRPMELWCQHRNGMHWDGIQPKPPVKDEPSQIIENVRLGSKAALTWTGQNGREMTGTDNGTRSFRHNANHVRCDNGTE